MNNFKKIIISSTLVCSFIFPTIIFADVTPPKAAGTSADQPLITCGGLNKDGSEQKLCTIGDLNQLVQAVLNLIFIFAGLIAASMFMYAGFLMVTSAGNASQIQKAKEVFKRVIIGFLIMFLAYVLVKNLLTKLDLETSVNGFFMGLFK
jgi:hypothetical protein